MAETVSVPLWLWVVLVLSVGCSIGGGVMYIVHGDVPFKVYAPPVGMLFAAIICIGTFLFVRSNIQLLELSLLLLIGTFASVGSVIRYRWNHGGKGRYERISAELMEKRRQRIEARNNKSR